MANERRRRRRRKGGSLSAKVGLSVVAVLVIVLGLLFARHGDRAATPPVSVPNSAIANGPYRLVVPFQAQHAGEIVAAEEKLFERAGLTVRLEASQPGYDPIASVARGDDAFGVTDAAGFLIARAHGAPIVAFGAGLLESPVSFFSLDSAQIRTPLDFVGRKVLRRPGTDAALIYDALVQNVGLARSQMQEVNGDLDVDALVKREIDVLPGDVAKLSYDLKERGLGFSVVRPADYGIHVPGTVYFTSQKFARAHPSLVQAFLSGVMAGWRRTYAEGAAILPALAAAIGEASADRLNYQLAVQRDLVLPSARRLAEFDELQWKQLRLILLITRMIDEQADLSGAVDYAFLTEAYRKPVSAAEYSRGTK